jgi:hypothetical protein
MAIVALLSALLRVTTRVTTACSPQSGLNNKVAGSWQLLGANLNSSISLRKINPIVMDPDFSSGVMYSGTKLCYGKGKCFTPKFLKGDLTLMRHTFQLYKIPFRACADFISEGFRG